MILPVPGVLARSHYDLALYSLAVRNVANYSPPVVELGSHELPEWEVLLRLAAIVGGQGGNAEAAATLDDFVLTSQVQKAVAREGGSVEGRDAGELVAELSKGGRRGPERVLDLMLRTGPYGDGFGANPDGLSLAVLEANPHGVDLGPAAAPPARGPAHADREDRARPGGDRRRRRGPPRCRRSPVASTASWCWSAGATCGRTTRGCTTSRCW